MKKIYFSLVTALAFCSGAYAQRFTRYDDFPMDASLGVGVIAPFFGNSDAVGGETFYSLSLSHFTRRGLGYRIGAQYAGYLVGVEKAFCFPLSLSYRTGMRSADDALTDAAYNIFMQDWFYTDGSSVFSILLSSLFFLFRQTEFDLGLTPGIICGESSLRTFSTPDNEQYQEGINKRSPLYLTADFACQFNIPIWRFCLYFSPGLHYVITNNFQVVERYSVSNLRWLFSGVAGIKFAF